MQRGGEIMRGRLERLFPIVVLVAGATGACDARHDIGGVGMTPADAGGRGGTNGSGGGGGSPADPGTNGQSGARMVGTLGPATSWTGYVENLKNFASWDTVTFSYATDAAGLAEGTVVFGMGTPPPPATDPNTGYPPGAQNPPLLGMVMQGFPYPLRGGVQSGRRLTFGVSWTDVWAGWCALQTPPAEDNIGGCLPNWGGSEADGTCSQRNPHTGQVVVVDCGKFYLCLRPGTPCSCSATACAAGGNQSVGFDMTLSIVGDAADGSVTGLFGDHNVHFTKDPAAQP
jgi:hypothetical protein